MTLVRGGDGNPLLCCWDDCQNFGHDEYKVVVRKNKQDPGLHYVFCGEFHRELYAHSQRHYGHIL